MLRTFILVGLLTGCGTNTIDAGSPMTQQTITQPNPEARAFVGTVIDSIESYFIFTLDGAGRAVSLLPQAFALTVPAMTTITVTSFLNASAGGTLQTENFGYFNALVKNNSNAVWNKTDIYLTVRYATVASQFQTATNDILTTSVDAPAHGAEAELVSLIPQCSSAGCGVRVYSFCNAAVGACAAKPVINTNVNNIGMVGMFSVPAGTYSGTLTWELVTTP